MISGLGQDYTWIELLAIHENTIKDKQTDKYAEIVQNKNWFRDCLEIAENVP